jgi:hypothetical protein
MRWTGALGILAFEVGLLFWVPVRSPGVLWVLMAVAAFIAWLLIAVELSKFMARQLEIPAFETAGDGDQPSSQLRKAYRLARRGGSATAVADACDLPQALAELIVDDVRRTMVPWGGRSIRRRFGM